MVNAHKTLLPLLLLLLILVATACGRADGAAEPEARAGEKTDRAASDVTPTAVATASPAPSPTVGPDQLACEVRGYACSLDEMAGETFEQGIAYADTAEERMQSGASTFEVVEWLDQQDDVKTAFTDGRVLVYQLQGSVPFIVEHPGVDGESRAPSRPQSRSQHSGQNEEMPRLSLALPSFLEPPAAHAQPVVSEPTDVVGSWRKGKAREKKRALILAPYLWQFDQYDETLELAEMLRETRWYEDGVTYVANADKSDQNITVEHFLNWDEYDMIHLSTHGRAVCREGRPCFTFLSTGIYMSPAERDKFKDRHSHFKGVGIAFTTPRSTGDGGKRVQLVVLSDFFKNYYGGGMLQNKSIFFSACEILAQSDMLHSLTAAADNSDFFAWTYSVYADDARAAALDLYEKMVVQGQAAGDAYRRVPEDKKFGLRSGTHYEVGVPYGIEPDEEGNIELVERTRTTDLQHHMLGQENNHLREVITLLHPQHKSLLTPGTVYPMGGQLDDGKPEPIDLLFKVEGYTEEEIKAEDILISFHLDDEPIVAYRHFLPADADDVEVTRQGEYEWLVRIEDVEIPDQQPDDTLKFKAALQLPKGDHSQHTVDPVRTSELDVRITLEGSASSPGESLAVTLDNKNQRARVDATTEGQSVSMFHDEGQQRSYMPDLDSGGYLYWDVPSGRTDPVRLHVDFADPAKWDERKLKAGNYQHETYTCAGDQTCDRYRTQHEGHDILLSYNENSRIAEVEINGPDGFARILYEYGDFTVQLPANAQPLPDLIDITFPDPGEGSGPPVDLPDLQFTPGGQMEMP